MTDSIRYQVAVIGASETTVVGNNPGMSDMMLAADAAMNAIADCGLDKSQIDGLFSAGLNQAMPMVSLAHYLGITPKVIDGTYVGGTSFTMNVRHAAAALYAGYCDYALVVMGESGYTRGDDVGLPDTRVRGWGLGAAAVSNQIPQQFEHIYGTYGPPTTFGMGILRYMKDFGLTHEQLASVPVAQSKWVNGNPRALRPNEVTVEDVLNSRMICYPIHLLECCVVTDAGGAIVLTRADRAKDFPKPPVYILGTGESVESPIVSQMDDLTTSRSFRVASAEAFEEAQLSHSDINHVGVYDAFAHLPIYGLEDAGFLKRGEAGAFIAEGRTSPGGELPLNTNGGGLCYTHSGMYGMYLMQESIRQLRGEAYNQVKDVTTSFLLGVGGEFASGGAMIWTNQSP